MFSLMPSTERQTQAAENMLWTAFALSFLLRNRALELTAAAANYYVYRCTVNAAKITTHLTGDDVSVKTASLKILHTERNVKNSREGNCFEWKKIEFTG